MWEPWVKFLGFLFKRSSMDIDKNNDSLEYCRYYKGEESNPFNGNNDEDMDAGFAWMSEKIAVLSCEYDPIEFLRFVLIHMGKWDPYSYGERMNRYLLANRNMPVEYRIRFVERFGKKDNPVLKKLLLEKFTSYWGGWMLDIMDHRSHEKIGDFLDCNQFAQDCYALGFEMDCGQSFGELYGFDFFKDAEKTAEPLENLFARVDNFTVLGNKIFSKWRDYGHWSHNPLEDFDPEWFKVAFERLGEMAE